MPEYSNRSFGALIDNAEIADGTITKQKINSTSIVAINSTTGKLPALTSTYIDNLDGTTITNTQSTVDYTIGDGVLKNITGSLNIYTANYTKVAEILISKTTMSNTTTRIKFWLHGDNNTTTVYGKIYVNGSARGTERIMNSFEGNTQYAEDITGINNGDLIQLYTKSVASPVSDGYAHDFTIAGSINVSSVLYFTQNLP
jgi:hypothetical protein